MTTLSSPAEVVKLACAMACMMATWLVCWAERVSSFLTAPNEVMSWKACPETTRRANIQNM
jgi:hypothetical protein